jgi:hypothetical protein
MARIKYKEAVELEVKRGRPPAGPAPRQLVLDKGKDLNEFYQLTRGGNE